MRLRFIISMALISLILIPLQAQDDGRLIPAGTYFGAITDDNASDRYTFEGIAGQEVIITMEALVNSSLDATLSLFDSNGELIQTDDDSAGNRNARITFTPRINDIFTIEATRYALNPPLTTGSYALTLSVTGDTTLTLDPLSLPPEFSVEYTTAQLDETITGTFTTGDNLQYFVVGAQQGDFTRVELTTGNNLVANIRILSRINQTLNVISRTARNTPSEEVIFATIPQTGWYLIEVERESGFGNFTLNPSLISDTLLSVETPTQAIFETDTDVLIFVFNGTINERVFVNLTVLEGQNVVPEISILDLSQNLLEQQSSEGAQVRANLNVPRSSPYIVEVRNLRSSIGTFELQLRRVPVDISKLPIIDADYNENYEGEISNTNPIDYYRFSGKAGELVTIEMVSIGANNLLDPYLILGDNTLNELIFNDNASASRAARVAQFALPADGDYFIIASRAGLSRGTTEGRYQLRITVGEIQLVTGALTATLTWEGEADLNLFIQTPTYTVSWANPSEPNGGTLQIDSNTGCETPTAQPIEHIYWDDNTEIGDYTIWVWYQDECRMAGDTAFTLTVAYQNETIFTATSGESDRVSLSKNERYEASIRLTDSGNAFIVNRGEITTPSAQQSASEGGDSLIVYGETISGSITDEVFAQFYQFEGNEGDAIIITVERVTSNLDPVVVLRDSLDINLANNDDVNPNNRNSEIIYTLPADGRYVIAVTRYGVRDGTTTGNYSLTLNRLAVLEAPSD